jgi:spectinomycin phosphotransferase
MTLLDYSRHERIVKDISEYAQQLLLTTAGGQDRIQGYRAFISQFDPQNVVEIAFKTDEFLIAR